MGEPRSLFRIRPNPDWDTDAEKLVRPGRRRSTSMAVQLAGTGFGKQVRS
jgi:hypothetical protein